MSTVTTARTTVYARFAAIVGERNTVPNERMRVHSLRKRNVDAIDVPDPDPSNGPGRGKLSAGREESLHLKTK